MRTLKVWLIYTRNAFQGALIYKYIVAFFLIGKSLRIALFCIFLLFLFQGTNSIAGYNRNQIIFFYLSFNLIDDLAQMLFREVYRFRELVVSGNLDFILVKPINPLIKVLLGGADVLDLIILTAVVAVTVWFGVHFITTNPFDWMIYLLMILNGLIIAAAFHIFVLGLGVITTTVDHLILVYRDFTSMFRIPVDLYIEPIRFILTFIIPLGIMLTFPAKVLMEMLSWQLVTYSLAFSLIILWLSMWFWQLCLRQYSSASS